MFKHDLLSWVLSGECSSFGVFGACSIHQGKAEACEKQSPSSLMGVQSFSCSKILKVLVIHIDCEQMHCSLQPVPPFFKGEFYS